jgi:hypothetical protein
VARDDDDRPARRKPKRSKPRPNYLLWGGAGAAVVVMLGLAVWGGIALFTRERGQLKGAAAQAVGKRLIPRDEFEKQVLGKIAEEIIHLHGFPPGGGKHDGMDVLHYYGVTMDPATGLPDAKTTIWFSGGARKVTY